EGTIGIVTGVSILAARRPSSVNAAILGVNSYDEVRQLFKQAKSDLCEILSAFEFWDGKCMDIASEYFKMPNPLSSSYPFYVLLETSGSNATHDEEKLHTFLEKAITDELAQDGVVAQDKTQQSKFWTVREGILQSMTNLGATFKYDISLPINKLYDIVPDVNRRLTEAGVYKEVEGKSDTDLPVLSVNGYGHIGDGNLHLNVVAKDFDPKIADLLEPFIYEWVESVNGSVSAEHGLGVMKADCLKYTKSSEMIDIMKQLKTLFDPNGIMNPYKFLPSS
ncbi:hypothetical protein BB560_007255, partial [Smittium megazygosporum]